jgi:uncharacterized protein YecE (DUF72 family)
MKGAQAADMEVQKNSGYFSGLSGLVLDIPKYMFPPPFQEASRLTYYASLFNSIEINSSFYKVPRAITVKKWVDSVPDNFRFTFKIWQEITHKAGFNFEETDVELFLKAIAPAIEKKGVLLLQFPPKLGREGLSRLIELLSIIGKHDVVKWPIAVEFRNSSWYHESTYKLLNELHVALVIQDIPKSATPLIDHLEDHIYIRFHGPKGDYRHGYTDDFLSEYATYIRDWLEEGKTVYVYFNNTIGDAFKNLKTLNKYILHS